jgi:cytochrome c553
MLYKFMKGRAFKAVRLFMLTSLACLYLSGTQAQEKTEAEYVGIDVCSECHSEQVKLWRGSHHDLAMQHATDTTVLADFNNTQFTYAGITSNFYKKNNKLMVRTDGPDGKLRDYEIKYAFGVTPLQQYLVELDKGRLQALTIAWDTRDKKDGGQRWFHLYPDEKISYMDELHWTRTNFNWNGMCAECHSTNLQKNYDSASDTFKTSWSEIDVSCEACHGPASNHISWAKKETGWESFNNNKGLSVLFDERKGVHWKINPECATQYRACHREGDTGLRAMSFASQRNLI